MPISQPATCDACNSRGVKEPKRAEYAVSTTAPGTYNEGDRPRAATLLCADCFRAYGGPDAFHDDHWKPFGQPIKPPDLP